MRKKRTTYRIGMRIGKRTIVAKEGALGKPIWKLRCDCGKIVSTRHIHQLGNKCKLCEGQYDTSHPLYSTWSGIKQRCYNKRSVAYQYYGGEGKILYDEWRDNFTAFAKWIEKNLGPKPSPHHEIDRINNEEGYVPKNSNGNPQLRWALPGGQAGNKRQNRSAVLGWWRWDKWEGSLNFICGKLGVPVGRVTGRFYYLSRKEPELSKVECLKISMERTLQSMNIKEDVVVF